MLWMTGLHFDHQRTLPLRAWATEPHCARGMPGKELGFCLLSTVQLASQDRESKSPAQSHIMNPVLPVEFGSLRADL